MADVPREQIRRCIIKKLGTAAWTYHPEAEFLTTNTTERHSYNLTNLLLHYGADPNIEDDGETLAHRVATENNKLLLRILRFQHMVKDNSTVLHYAAKRENEDLDRATCEQKNEMDVNQGQEGVMTVLLEHGRHNDAPADEPVNVQYPPEAALAGKRPIS
ncbi:hypothetical protein OUZ56_012180 [Daphnia magna]|uniref:Uncharacterized protein n=1 Tax=Daphnia magna TaxID=35525 RepID=A0ABQ9Z2K5_9CRUS|nr:hypothetical protein OUZ56_012180 [Daphnia magna]